MATDEGSDTDITELRRFMEWFETIGLPLPKDPQLVKINTGWYSWRDGVCTSDQVTGILVESKGNNFKALIHHNYEERKFTKHPRDTTWLPELPAEPVPDSPIALSHLPSHIMLNILEMVIGLHTNHLYFLIICYGVSHLGLVCRKWYRMSNEPSIVPAHRVVNFEVLNVLDTPPDDLSDSFFRARQKSAWIYPAYIAYKQGHQEFSFKILQTLQEDVAREDSHNWREKLVHHVLYNMIWRNTLDFQNRSISWATLLQKFSILSGRFPSGKYSEKIDSTVRILRQMVEEEKQHAAAVKGKDMSKLSKEENIAELIYQLRTQRGFQWGQPGSCDLWSDSRGKKSPLALLADYGYEVIPFLAEHIQDETFTRSVGYHRDFFFSHRVLSVGECCRAAFYKISDSSTTNMLQWYEEYKNKGEKQVLIQGVLKGDNGSDRQFEKLAKLYPDCQLPVLLQVLEVPGLSDWLKNTFITKLSQLSKNPQDEAGQAIFRLISKDSLHMSCKAAGFALALGFDKNEVCQLVKARGALQEDLSNWDEAEITRIWAFIKRANDTELIQIGMQIWERMSPHKKVNIIESVLDSKRNSFGFYDDAPPKSYIWKTQGEVNKIWVDPVVAFLHCQAVYPCSGCFADQTYNTPKVCEWAASRMSMACPDVYKFRFVGDQAEHDTKVAEVLQAFLTLHHRL